MKYNLTTPCSLCPFRNDAGRLFVHPSVLRQMAEGEFCCHKTGVCNEETGDIEPAENSQHCAGLLIMLEKMQEPHQMMRIVERLGMYDRTKLNMNAPVFASIKEASASKKSPNRRGMRKDE